MKIILCHSRLSQKEPVDYCQNGKGQNNKGKPHKRKNQAVSCARRRLRIAGRKDKLNAGNDNKNDGQKPGDTEDCREKGGYKASWGV